MIADDRDMVEIFIFVLNQKTGPSGIIPLDQVHAAGQLTDAASCTFVKMSVDKGFDNFLLNRFFILKISHIMYYVNDFFIAFKKKLWYVYESHITYYVI